ncbi:hypothetical protein HJ581_0027860 [Rhodococcus opacus]|nr:hypothetical protein HJ581_0027860 [Rhodococcus opacus]
MVVVLAELPVTVNGNSASTTTTDGTRIPATPPQPTPAPRSSTTAPDTAPYSRYPRRPIPAQHHHRLRHILPAQQHRLDLPLDLLTPQLHPENP